MSTINQVIPTVGVFGKYTVSSPFDAIINPNKNHTCVRVQDYPSAVTDLDNTLYESVYEPRGLSREDFDKHMRAGVLLVTLKNESGESFYIPASYISGIPSSNTTAYNCLMITAQLGPLPINENIGTLRDYITDAIIDYYGVSPLVNVVRYGASEAVTPSVHAAITNIRNRKKVALQTKSSQVAALTAERNKLKQQVGALAKIIKDNGLVA